MKTTSLSKPSSVPIQNKLKGRLLGYSATAATVLAAAPGVEAQISVQGNCAGDTVIHCDVDPDEVFSPFTQYLFDFNDDGVNDMRLGQILGTRSNIILAYAYPLNAFLGTGVRDFVQPLPYGATISPSDTDFDHGGYILAMEWCETHGFPCHPAGPFPGKINHHMGVRFDVPGGSPHLGWVRLDTPSFRPVVVKAYGYHTQANQAIQAGQGLPLPVELVSFTARSQDARVWLSWLTASETNNAGFEVQSRLADQEWKNEEFVTGAGTTTESQTYSFTTGELTPGSYQFRLKQIDFDGTFEYSSMVEATIEVPGTHVLLPAYPNPFRPSTQVTLILARTQPVHIQVFDVRGQLVRTLHGGVLEAGTQHRFSFEAVDLPGGTYIIRATGENFTETQKVMLVK